MLCKLIRSIALLFLATTLCACGTSTAAPTAPVETVTVTFRPNNGEADILMEVEKGQPVSNAPTPTKRGCEFAGWFLDLTPWKTETKPVTEPVTLTAKWKLSEDAFQPNPNAAVRTEGTDVRICSFNLLSPLRGTQIPIGQRADHFLQMAQAYQPDVIGVQEYDEPWHPAFLEAFRDTHYQLVSGKDGRLNSRQILYRTDRLTLLEYGLESNAVSSLPSYTGTFIWALFETKDASAQRFLVISAHWYWDSPDARVEESYYLVQWVEAAKKTYNVPILFTGDYNATEEEYSYCRLLDECSLQDAKYSARTRGLVAYTCHSPLTISGYTVDKVNTLLSIDHILHTGDAIPLYYDTIIDENALSASDHNPIYADFQFSS